jgi:hypothetical protein
MATTGLVVCLDSFWASDLDVVREDELVVPIAQSSRSTRSCLRAGLPTAQLHERKQQYRKEVFRKAGIE